MKKEKIDLTQLEKMDFCYGNLYIQLKLNQRMIKIASWGDFIDEIDTAKYKSRGEFYFEDFRCQQTGQVLAECLEVLGGFAMQTEVTKARAQIITLINEDNYYSLASQLHERLMSRADFETYKIMGATLYQLALLRAVTHFQFLLKTGYDSLSILEKYFRLHFDFLFHQDQILNWGYRDWHNQTQTTSFEVESWIGEDCFSYLIRYWELIKSNKVVNKNLLNDADQSFILTCQHISYQGKERDLAKSYKKIQDYLTARFLLKIEPKQEVAS